MQKIRVLMRLGFLCLILQFQEGWAQSRQVDRSEWLQQMNDAEVKITAYVDKQINNKLVNDSLKQTFLSSAETHELKGNDLAKFLEDRLRYHYRTEYLNAHPDVVEIYNPGRVLMTNNKAAGDPDAGALPKNVLCNYGDFENAALNILASQGFNGYASTYTGGVCNFVPPNNVAYNNISFTSSTYFFDITNNIPDPIVPALSQTNNGSNHAIRINSSALCPTPDWIVMLQKSFSMPSGGKAKINFSYALVVEDPPYDHMNANTFFLARVLDGSGTEVGRLCVPSDPNDFQATPYVSCGLRGAKVMWKDWSCASISFDAVANTTYTIEFFVADCSGKMHFEYAYVDDICADILCCANIPAPPDKPSCTTLDIGSQLSWDPVPGAVYYKVFINEYDPECCSQSAPPNPISYILNVVGTDVTVQKLTSPCFSWFVSAVMPDSCKTGFSEKKCSCNPKPPTPQHLDCDPLFNGSRLYWDPVPGVDHYKIQINQYDPLCCDKSPVPNPISAIWTSITPTIDVPSSFADCFSWTVTAVMLNGEESDPSITKCSCTPTVGPPVDPDCDSVFGASRLSWGSVPGAVSYKVTINQYDPACCDTVPVPNPISVVWNVTGLTVDVPHLFATCFSWWVTAVLANGRETERSEKKCSCSDPTGSTNPPDLDFPSQETGKAGSTSELHVTAVPNPATDNVEFTVYGESKDGLAGVTLYLYDQSGKEVARKEFTNGKVRLDVQSYPDGLYIFVVRSNKNEILFKDKIAFKK